MALGEEAGKSGVKLNLGKRKSGAKVSLNLTINLMNLNGHLMVDLLHTLRVLTGSSTPGFKWFGYLLDLFCLKLTRLSDMKISFTVFLNVEFRRSKEKKGRDK